jgi:hypothetical protein
MVACHKCGSITELGENCPCSDGALRTKPVVRRERYPSMPLAAEAYSEAQALRLRVMRQRRNPPEH